MKIRTCVFIAALVSAISLQDRADAQTLGASNDPLRQGRALLIGNFNYKDTGWPRLDDVPLQITALEKGLKNHFDAVEVALNLDIQQLREKISGFLRVYGNS